MVNAHGQQNIRFSLYLSSQLLYGTTKLLSYQTKLFQEFVFKVQRELQPVDLNKKRKTVSESETTVEINMADIPSGTKTFKNLHLQPDLHLMPEADIENIRGAYERLYVSSPTFGELAEDLVDFFLMDVEQTVHIMLDQGRDISKEPMRLVADDSNEPRPWGELSRPPVPQIFDTTDQGHTDEGSSLMNVRQLTPKTPQKRKSAMTNADTPTKRCRQNLGKDFITAAEQRVADVPIPLANLTDDQPVNIPMGISDVPMNVTENIPTDMSTEPPIELPINIPIDPTVPPGHQPSEMTIPEDNDVHLGPIEIEPVRSIRKKRSHKRIDEGTILSDSELKKLIGNVNAHTRTLSVAQIVPEGRRHIPAYKMLQMPSTAFHPISQRRKIGPLGINWASGLVQNFLVRTFGPFEAETHHTLEPEIRRAEDSRIQQAAGEISGGLQTAAGLQSLQCNKTTDDRSAEVLELIDEQVVPEIPKEVDEPSMPNLELHDITNGPMIDTNDADTVSVSKQPQSDGQTNPIGAEARLSTSDMDPDAFLPPGMRTRTDARGTDNNKGTSSVAITDHPGPLSPSTGSPFVSSDVSTPSSWNKTTLWATLEDFWSRTAPHNPITLKQLMPLQTTTKKDAAVCFMFLLELSEEKKVKLAQADVNRNIYITKII